MRTEECLATSKSFDPRQSYELVFDGPSNKQDVDELRGKVWEWLIYHNVECPTLAPGLTDILDRTVEEVISSDDPSRSRTIEGFSPLDVAVNSNHGVVCETYLYRASTLRRADLLYMPLGQTPNPEGLALMEKIFDRKITGFIKTLVGA